jgi:hypothetical protein
MAREEKKRHMKKNSNHPLAAPAASPAVGVTAPVGGGGLVAAAAAAWVGVAAVPVVVSEVVELLTLSTVAAFSLQHSNENPTYVFLFWKSRPQPQFPHSCVCERFI